MKSVINSSSSSSSLFILISWSLLLLLLSHCVVVFSTLNNEGVALLSLLNKFSFADKYSVKLNWNNNLSSSSNTTTTPCDWSGVGCNTQKTHIVSLSLSGFNIYGQLGPQIGQLTYLKSIDLSSNHFNGRLPLELWNCSRLQYLDLSKNQFSGRIPEYLFQNSGLEEVYLSDNNLTGSIPVNIGNATRMKKLYLSKNQLDGNIPTSIANCIKLENLWLDKKALSGEIPLGVWRIPTLVEIDVTKNNLSGELPEDEMTTGLHHLYSISLSQNQFFGSIPKDLGFNNTDLEFVDFSDNAFSGEIPLNLCFGQKLTEIILDHNQFHGDIPSSYTQNCDSLHTLSLQGNNLTGSLPHFGNNLSYISSLNNLDLSRNNIHGQISSWICNVTSLLTLDLSENQMNGTLPHCLGDLINLHELYLRSNNFSGTIPWNFTNYYMNSLDLNGNCLEGKIPRSLGINSPDLFNLDLGNNQLEDTFPSFLAILWRIEVLILRSNRLYGPLEQYPHSGYLPCTLRILDLSNNFFSGNLPLRFFLGLDMKNIDVYDASPDINYLPILAVVIHKGKKIRLNNTMMNTFRAIDMSNNRFQGSIPESIGELLILTSLNLSNNNLNGRIPSSLGNLTQLESLDLSKNKIFGEIPGQLTNLTFLEVLNLSHNNLTGHIPTAGQFPTYPNCSFDGNPGLCGLQSSTGCGGSHLRDPDVEKESYEDSSSWNFGWEPVVIGYGCGVLIGLVLQYFIFTKASMYRWFG